MSTSGPTTDIVLDELAISGRVVAYHVPAPGRQQLDFVRSFDGRSGARLRRSAKFRRHRTAGCAVQRVAVATYSRGAIVWLANGVLRALDSRGSRAGGSDGAAGS